MGSRATTQTHTTNYQICLSMCWNLCWLELLCVEYAIFVLVEWGAQFPILLNPLPSVTSMVFLAHSGMTDDRETSVSLLFFQAVSWRHAASSSIVLSRRTKTPYWFWIHDNTFLFWLWPSRKFCHCLSSGSNPSWHALSIFFRTDAQFRESVQTVYLRCRDRAPPGMSTFCRL